MHIGFDDPAEAKGSDEEVLSLFRRVRDEIGEEFLKFHHNLLKP
jgi:arsenate reductase